MARLNIVEVLRERLVSERFDMPRLSSNESSNAVGRPTAEPLT